MAALNISKFFGTGFFFLLIAVTPAQAGIVNIIAIGDSISHGQQFGGEYGTFKSYRDPLYEIAVDSGFNPMVGEVGNTPGPVDFNFAGPQTLDNGGFLYSDFDNEHAAFSGARPSDYESRLSPATGGAVTSVESLVTTYSIDVAIVLLGVNDLRTTTGGSGFNGATTFNTHMQPMLDRMAGPQGNPALKILLGAIAPITNDPTGNGNILDYNLALSNYALSRPNVDFIDHYNGVGAFPATNNISGVGSFKTGDLFSGNGDTDTSGAGDGVDDLFDVAIAGASAPNTRGTGGTDTNSNQIDDLYDVALTFGPDVNGDGIDDAGVLGSYNYATGEGTLNTGFNAGGNAPRRNYVLDGLHTTAHGDVALAYNWWGAPGQPGLRQAILDVQAAQVPEPSAFVFLGLVSLVGGVVQRIRRSRVV